MSWGSFWLAGSFGGGGEGLSTLLEVARLIRRAPNGRGVHSELLSSLAGALGSVEFARFISRAPRGGWIHSGSFGSFGGRLKVMEGLFIHLGGAYGSLGFPRFIWSGPWRSSVLFGLVRLI